MIEKKLNPFINTLVVPYLEMVTKTELDPEGGMKVYGYKVERERYARVYVKPGLRDMLFKKLSDAGLKLFWFVIYSTNPDHEYTVMSYDKVNDGYRDGGARPVSPRGYKEALKELISLNLLDVKSIKDDQYWINPSFFCPGDRIGMFPQCTIKVGIGAGRHRELNSKS